MIPQRSPLSPRVISVRSLVPADLEALRPHSARQRLAKLRESHHIIARLLASGLTHREVAHEAGYNHSRVSILAADPSMKELISTYRAEDTEAWRESRDEYYERIHRVGAKALRQVEDQLDDADEDGTAIPINRLLAIADSASDRIGYQKRTTNVNVNVDFAKNLEAAIARSRKTIEHEPAE